MESSGRYQSQRPNRNSPPCLLRATFRGRAAREELQSTHPSQNWYDEEDRDAAKLKDTNKTSPRPLGRSKSGTQSSGRNTWSSILCNCSLALGGSTCVQTITGRFSQPRTITNDGSCFQQYGPGEPFFIVSREPTTQMGFPDSHTSPPSQRGQSTGAPSLLDPRRRWCR